MVGNRIINQKIKKIYGWHDIKKGEIDILEVEIADSNEFWIINKEIGEVGVKSLCYNVYNNSRWFTTLEQAKKEYIYMLIEEIAWRQILIDKIKRSVDEQALEDIENYVTEMTEE